jgi:hypothetical protein
MTPKCSLCGTYESENTTVIPDFDACHECISMLVENEIDRRHGQVVTQSQSGDDHLAQIQIEAQQLRR